MFTPAVHQITPPAVAAARKIIGAGQVRAQRLIDRIEAQCSGSAILEVGALCAMVRNLCAELAAFDKPDGYIEVRWNDQPFSVDPKDGMIEVNGYDITKILDAKVRESILCIAEEKTRELMIEEGQRARDDADYERYVERAA